MSERESVGRFEIWLVWLLVIFAIVGVFHYRAQIRDLQRRIATLESERR